MLGENIKGKKVILHDMSLRDGMHAKRHQITLDQMRSVAGALDEAGVDLIEVTHGDGLGGRSVNYGFPAHSDEEYLKATPGGDQEREAVGAAAAGDRHGRSLEDGCRLRNRHDPRRQRTAPRRMSRSSTSAWARSSDSTWSGS